MGFIFSSQVLLFYSRTGVLFCTLGLLLVQYIPNETVLNLLKETGSLPVIDYLCISSMEQSNYEYFIPGNTIGELSTLTKRSYDGRITADTHSEAFFLSADTIKRAIQMDPDPVNGLVVPLLSMCPNVHVLVSNAVYGSRLALKWQSN